jgi:hypothetical protein
MSHVPAIVVNVIGAKALAIMAAGGRAR